MLAIAHSLTAAAVLLRARVAHVVAIPPPGLTFARASNSQYVSLGF